MLLVSPNKLTQTKSQKIKHIFPYLLVALLIIASIGAIYQNRAEARDLLLYPAPGTRISIQDEQTGLTYNLHLYCEGEPASETPTVILIHGAGDNSTIWSLVQHEIAKDYQVCSYDRAGYGWSDVGPSPRSVEQNARELQMLLSAAGIEPPYLLVGHSLGGLIARQYAAEYNQQVAGVVMVDSTNADELAELSPVIRNVALRIPLIQARVCEGMAFTGLYRLFTESNAPDAGMEKLPVDIQPSARALRLRTDLCSTLFGEQRAMIDDVVKLQHSGDLGDIPLTIMLPWQDETEKVNQIARQKYWSNLSSQVKFVMVENSSHYIHIDQPQSVLAAVLELAEIVQK